MGKVLQRAVAATKLKQLRQNLDEKNIRSFYVFFYTINDVPII